MMSKPTWLAVLLIAAGGCLGAIGGDQPEGGEAPGDPAAVEPQGEIPGLDNDAVIEKPAATRRLTVDELQATIGVVAGNDGAGQPIGWKVKIGANTVDALSNGAFGRTLGRPDYVNVTEEDPSPGPLYLKFTQDMARNLCHQLVTADLARAEGDTPTLWRHAPIDGEPTAEQLEENIAYLALRFWGFEEHEIADRVAPLSALHAAGVAATVAEDTVPAQARGWQAVCIGMLQDPAFHLH